MLLLGVPDAVARFAGGTPSSVATYVVKCCQKNGTKLAFCTTCDFNHSPPRCKDVIYHSAEVPDGGVLSTEP